MPGLDAYTKLLIHANGTDGATTYTAETGQTVTFVGDAQLDTAQAKFGASSVLLDGTGDWFEVPDSSDWDFGSGDFTLDFCVRFNNTTPQQDFITHNHTGTLAYHLLTSVMAGNIVRFYAYDGSAVQAQYDTSSAVTFNTGQWYHLAFVRNGTTGYIFVDGVSQTLTATVPFGNNVLVGGNSTLQIGAQGTRSRRYVNGWMDEVRVSKGIARWTANFTPPSAEYNDLADGGFMTCNKGWL